MRTRRRVERRPIGIQPCAFAIHRAAGGQQHMVRHQTAGRERIDHRRGSDDIDVCVARGLGQRLPGAGLGSKVHHDGRVPAIKHLFPGRGLGDIADNQLHVRIQCIRPARFRVDLGMQVVHRHDGKTKLFELRGERTPDEACAARDDYCLLHCHEFLVRSSGRCHATSFSRGKAADLPGPTGRQRRSGEESRRCSVPAGSRRL